MNELIDLMEQYKNYDLSFKRMARDYRQVGDLVNADVYEAKAAVYWSCYLDLRDILKKFDKQTVIN